MNSPLPPSGLAGSTSTDVLIWVCILIVAVLFLGALILVVRKRMLAKDSAAADNWIGDLRQMHKRGELSTEEYEAARRALTARFAGGAGAPAAAPSQRSARPHAPRDEAGELRAKPGFDLTGAPLPPRQPPPPSTPRPGGPYDRKPPP